MESLSNISCWKKKTDVKVAPEQTQETPTTLSVVVATASAFCPRWTRELHVPATVAACGGTWRLLSRSDFRHLVASVGHTFLSYQQSQPAKATTVVVGQWRQRNCTAERRPKIGSFDTK